ncbi:MULTISPECIES: serine/threonine-protein kinase [unclassified Streptomyces]|uniref:serine/threonine-protein kinase n=1 Tax=unclassified Streptomyces TaxID=2593676 RepID=UPI002257B526|nr:MULTISPECIES: serine/threonine-protein kinase [unclassified Streptomyces]MCX5331961.1 protein kinase [Streptomyces sp. NBC_00140]MCX5361362.1 protein kinase [Streptomyces sp. NBC_00124]
MQGLLLAGRYRLADTIGSGGMGRVWRAHDEVLHRAVAIKELTAALYVSESDQERLLHRTRAEARAAARINHSAVVTVHDVLDHDARPWIVMELIEGRSLADEVKAQGRVEPAEAARIGLWVLRALRAAHSAGVLHRDVKPGNVLLSQDGRVLLTDFGIAQIEGDTTITRTGEVVGSVDYLAPERVRGHDPGPASDLWALGATLYTAVEGRSPFRRTSPIGTMQAVVEEQPAEPVNAGALGPVLAALLRKDPAERPSAAEAEQMLAEAAEGRSSAAAQAYVSTGQVRYEPSHTTGAGTHAQTAAATPYPPVMVGAPVPPAPRKRHRLRTFALVVALAAIVGGGVAVALQQFGTDSTGDSASPTPTPSASATPSGEGGQGAVPAGWERRDDPAGFSVYLPKGWERSVSIKSKDGLQQIDYSPDKGEHLVRIAVDTSPDYDDPYLHEVELEQQLNRQLADYGRVSLQRQVYRDRQGSRLEYTWTEQAQVSRPPGEYRAVDLMYIAQSGVEYAICMASPVEDWDTTRKQFEAVLQGWRERAVER